MSILRLSMALVEVFDIRYSLVNPIRTVVEFASFQVSGIQLHALAEVHQEFPPQ